MFGLGLSPYVDTSTSIQAAERALADLKPEGYGKVRGYLSVIFEKWKLQHGKPPSQSQGLLGAFAAPEADLPEPQRLASIKDLVPWQCAGLGCANAIDLFLKIWREYDGYLNDILKGNEFLFFWFLGMLIIDHRNDDDARYSIVNAGQVLLSIYLSSDKSILESYEKELGSLTQKTVSIAISRKKGGAATAAIKKAKGQATTDDIHRRATELLKTKEKKDVAGIIKTQTNYSKSTIHAALKSHPLGLWQKSSAS